MPTTTIPPMPTTIPPMTTLVMSQQTRIIMFRILNILAVLFFLVAGLMVVLRLTVLRPHHDRHPRDEDSPTTVIVPRNMTVAQDGSGDFLSVADAVAAAPNHSDDFFGILIRSGVYLEAVRVPKEKTKLVFIGEGHDRTVISSTKRSLEKEQAATAWISGEGFVGINISFENTADPAGSAFAIALFNDAETSAFYLCAFKGYKNVIGASRNRQFYRDCLIYGATDVIFGDAAAVFQNCTLYVGKMRESSSSGNYNVLTVQERGSPIFASGFVFQDSAVRAAGADGAQLVAVAYLGRPGGEYSRVVLLRCFLDRVVSPQGWLRAGANESVLRTLYYGEYQSGGPGWSPVDRVSWAGFRVIRKAAEANNFTVGSFIAGEQWLPQTGVKFDAGLI